MNKIVYLNVGFNFFYFLFFDNIMKTAFEHDQVQRLIVVCDSLSRSRISAIASLRSGNKKTALRHARELKLASESRDRCTSLLNRLEEILTVISNVESAKTVLSMIPDGFTLSFILL